MFYSPSSLIPFAFLENAWILKYGGTDLYDLRAKISFMPVSCLWQAVAWCHDYLWQLAALVRGCVGVCGSGSTGYCREKPGPALGTC